MRLLFLLLIFFVSVPVAGQSAALGVGDTTVNAGDPATVQLRLTNDTVSDGFSLGVSCDPAFLLPSVVTPLGFLVSDPPDFIDTNLLSNGFTMGVIQDLGTPFVPILVGTDQAFAEATYLTAAAGTTHTALLLVSTLGIPAVPLLVVFDGGLTEVVPTVVNGCVTLLGTANFQRGDANHNGLLTIGDAVAMITRLFGGALGSCDDADDANDDSELGVADPVYLLTYLFDMGPPPPAPFLVCGSDASPDGLGCDNGGCP